MKKYKPKKWFTYARLLLIFGCVFLMGRTTNIVYEEVSVKDNNEEKALSQNVINENKEEIYVEENPVLTKYISLPEKGFNLTLGTALFIVNGTVLIIGTFIFGIEALLISLIIRYIESKIIDTFLTGISDSKILFINTDKIEEITKYIIEEIESGVSEIKVTSGFKKQKNTVLMCVVPTEKYLLLKSQIIQIDNDAFITVMDSYEVYGGTNRYKLPLHDLRI